LSFVVVDHKSVFNTALPRLLEINTQKNQIQQFSTHSSVIKYSRMFFDVLTPTSHNEIFDTFDKVLAFK